MTDTTTDNYEELIVGVLLDEYNPPASYTIGLYNDSVDSISPSDDETAISTEPEGASYTRKQVDRVNCSASTQNGNRRLNIPEVTFNTEDSDTGIDSFFIMAEFNDGSTQEYRMITTTKIESQEYSVDLSNTDRYVVSNIYIEHSEV